MDGRLNGKDLYSPFQKTLYSTCRAGWTFGAMGCDEMPLASMSGPELVLAKP